MGQYKLMIKCLETRTLLIYIILSNRKYSKITASFAICFIVLNELRVRSFGSRGNGPRLITILSRTWFSGCSYQIYV